MQDILQNELKEHLRPTTTSMIIHFLGPLVLNGSSNLVVAIFVEDSLSKNVYALKLSKDVEN